MPDDFWMYAFLCASAFLAGVMNSVAGGGTLLTFPALTALVSPALANGTSTVALLPGSFAGALGYRKELWECRRFVLRMIAPSIAGGFLGAWLVGRNQEAFALLVPWLILTGRGAVRGAGPALEVGEGACGRRGRATRITTNRTGRRRRW